VSPDPTVPAGPPPQVRLAGVLVAVQALLALGFAGVLVVRASSAELPVSFVLGEAGYFAVIGAALLAVGIGLVGGRRWARSPAIVTQLLLLPVVYSLLSSRQALAGVVCGVWVFAAFMLLLNERSRLWSMGVDPVVSPDPARRRP
jgi:hypothetical protein